MGEINGWAEIWYVFICSRCLKIQRFDFDECLGDVLVTISTGEMSEETAAERGLVPTHAYAVIGK